MNPTSVDIKDILVSEGGFTFGTDLFIGTQPPTPLNCVTLFDTTTSPPDGTIDGNNVFFQEGLMLWVRNESYEGAYLQAQGILSLLHNRAGFTQNETFYLYCNLQSGPNALGEGDDEEGTILTLNFNLQRKSGIVPAAEFITFVKLVAALVAGTNVTLDINLLGETITINADAEEQVQSDWNQVDAEEVDYIKNKPTIPSDVSDLSDDTNLLFSGDYNDLDNPPDLSSLHIQNTDTILDEDGTYEVTAQEIREHIDNADIHFEIDDVTPATDSVYSSDKVDDLLSGKENTIGFTPENVTNKVTSFQVTPDDIHYASEKLVKDSLDNKEDTLGYTPTQKLTATVTIAVADWEGGLTCTKTVTGLLATDTVLPVIDDTNRQLIADFGIKKVEIAAGTLTFTAETTPDSEITFTIDYIRGTAIGGGVVWFGGVSGGGGGLDKTFQTLTEDATITFNAATSVNGSVTLTASRIAANIANPVVGEDHTWRFVQGGTGSYGITWGNQYKTSGGAMPGLSTTVGAVDLYTFKAISASEFVLTNVIHDYKAIV